MLDLSSTLLLVRLLAVGATASPSLCAAREEEAATRCIELTVETVGQVHEIQVSPGLSTTLFFDSEVVEVKVAGQERFQRVRVAQDTIVVRPSSDQVWGERLPVSVRFADGLSPARADFILVVHPAMGERLVDVLRRPRSSEDLRADLARARAEVQRLSTMLERLHRDLRRPPGLLGLFASGAMGEGGIPSLDLTRRVDVNMESARLFPRTVMSYHAPGRAAILLELEGLGDRSPWMVDGAVLMGAKGELLRASAMQDRPIISGEGAVTIRLEAELSDEQALSSYTLKMWQADGSRTLSMTLITFPKLRDELKP